MGLVYLFEYFLFTFFASFGTIQIALAGKYSFRLITGITILIASYVWFFASRGRNVPTVVEGVQLLVIFAFATFLAIIATKILTVLVKEK